jgi:peroxiredoxin
MHCLTTASLSSASSLRWLSFLCLSLIITATSLYAEDEPSTDSGASLAAEGETDMEVLEGHSFHGEVFNEGPRQSAYLMAGMGHTQFPITTSNSLTQRFFNQGVAQLHGFWYYEAERSFRQAAHIDPECAMSYWGMAQANLENRKRARDFIAEAVKRQATVTAREQLYIDAFVKYCRDEDEQGKKIEKKERAQQYTDDLEKIVQEYPEDIEARAFLGLQLWLNTRSDLPIVSHVAVDSVLQDVFDADPMHPAHHYRIHLWDKRNAERATGSAALCGQSLPGIAHMWHMPGHTYSKLHRYHDAAWQQEASARVDHAHMMRDRVLPDQIHNFAHNNEWLIRNLLKVGRVADALSLAKNMIELPRHPKYNTLQKGSTKLGRERLYLTLASYRLWPELIELSDGIYLEAPDDEKLSMERTKHLAIAHALSGDAVKAADMRLQLEQELSATQKSIQGLNEETEAFKPQAESNEPSNELAEPTDSPNAENVSEKAERDEELKAAANRKRRIKEIEGELKERKELVAQLEKYIASIRAVEAAARTEWEAAVELWKDSDLEDNLLKAEWMAAGGEYEDALELIDKEIDKLPGEILPYAVKSWIQFLHRNASEATVAFEMTRSLAGAADLQTPLLARLTPLANTLGYEFHWAPAYQPPDDVGIRPALDTLGPFRWRPYIAPNFSVTRQDGSMVRHSQLRGKPTLVIFYLGFGCLHCVEQLHKFSPRVAQFKESGIDLIAISSEDGDSLKTALSNYTEPLGIPLHVDPELIAFKSFRCFDDFEQQPLHGTFLIDPEGKVLWQDISYEPFMDVDFALSESHRLLKLAGFGDRLSEPKPFKLIATQP